MNSVFKGKKIELEVYGGSHEPLIGFFLRGVPKVEIDQNKIIKDILKRKPSYIGSTERKEEDIPIFVSGIDNNSTDGGVINVEFKNNNIRKEDYNEFYNHPRPGHADFVTRKKYSKDKYVSGGGLFSGRMTLPLVVAGSICKQILPVFFTSSLVQIGTLKNVKKLDEYLKELKEKGDSAGGIIETTVTNVPVGLGGPLFDKLTIKIAQTVLAIPGVKGIEFGEGFNSTNLLGSQFNDLIINSDGKTRTNHAGGINGGISNGNDLIIRVAFRPPSSISIPQQTYSFETNQIESLSVNGRHDVSYVPRALIIVESMIALALLDEFL